jgi:type I restriction enzyme R subunit
VKPEARARQKIDQLLAAAGWNVQHFEQLNLSAALGVAVREFPLKLASSSLITYTGQDFLSFMEDNLHLRLLTFCLTRALCLVSHQ